MPPERRRAERTATASIAYIHLAPDNGGIVLNISEDGLAFHSAAPIQSDIAVHFWISLRANERIEGTGELAWTDQSGKTGGLRLTALSEAARRQIASWIQQPSGGEAASRIETTVSQELKVAPAAPVELPGTARPAAENSSEKGASPAIPEREPKPKKVPAAKPTAKKAAPPVSAQNSATRLQQSKMSGTRPLRLVVLLVALAAMGAAFLYRDRVGSFLIYIGSQLSHASRSKNGAGTAGSASSGAPASLQAFPALSTAQREELATEIEAFDRENREEEAQQARVLARRSASAFTARYAKR